MINRIKAHCRVYAGHWEVALIILGLVLGGVVTGYVLRGAQMTAAIAAIQAMHVQEVERIQRENRATLALLASRIGVVAEEQAQAAGKVEEAARTAIRVREIPAEPVPAPAPASPWPERIEP